MAELKIKKSNLWLDHVRKYREENPEVSYKDALKIAKETYVKAVKVKKSCKGTPVKEVVVVDLPDDLVVGVVKPVKKARKPRCKKAEKIVKMIDDIIDIKEE